MFGFNKEKEPRYGFYGWDLWLWKLLYIGAWDARIQTLLDLYTAFWQHKRGPGASDSAGA